MTRRRWLFAGTVTLAAAQCFVAFWVVAIAWLVCCWLVRMDFTIALSVTALLNVFGLLAFAIRSRSWGTTSLGAVQVGNILFALAASVAVSPAWLLTDAAPALVTLILVSVCQSSEASRPLATT